MNGFYGKNRENFSKKFMAFSAIKNNYRKIATHPIALLSLNRLYSENGNGRAVCAGYWLSYCSAVCDSFLLCLQMVRQFPHASL